MRRTRRLTVVAQDPGVRTGPERRILTAPVQLPYEELGPGPTGHRVHVVDYDSSTQTFYEPTDAPAPAAPPTAPAAPPPPTPSSWATPASTPRTSTGWSCAPWPASSSPSAGGWRGASTAHQLKVVPHAFEAANAFYSPESESLLFGYFRRRDELVFTCLSHDVVVHETTHALLDGLRGRFMAPSSPDQAAFHEGYADIVALLSVFSMQEVLAELVDKAASGAKKGKPDPEGLIHRTQGGGRASCGSRCCSGWPRRWTRGWPGPGSTPCAARCASTPTPGSSTCSSTASPTGGARCWWRR